MYRLLKKKRQDDSFGNFLEIKRGAAMHTLESLMMLPVSDFTHSLTHSLTDSLTHTHTHSLTCSLARSLTHSLTHSPHPLTHMTHSPTHLLQVQRVSEYHNSLSQLLALTPLEHPDHHHLQTTVARMKEVRIRITCTSCKERSSTFSSLLQIIKAREEELLYLESEVRIHA